MSGPLGPIFNSHCTEILPTAGHFILFEHHSVRPPDKQRTPSLTLSRVRAGTRSDHPPRRGEYYTLTVIFYDFYSLRRCTAAFSHHTRSSRPYVGARGKLTWYHASSQCHRLGCMQATVSAQQKTLSFVGLSLADGGFISRLPLCADGGVHRTYETYSW